MPSQQKTSTSETKSQPYGVQYWNKAQKEASRLYDSGGPEYFPYSTVAPLNQYQMQTMDLASQGAAGKLDPVFENVRSKVMPSIDAAYSRGGRRPTGAGSYGAVAADALTNAYAPFAQQQYNTDFDRLYQSGKDYNQFQQANVQDSVNRFNFYQNRPYDQLARLQQGLNVSGGGQGASSTTNPYYYNPFAQAGGTALQMLPYLFGGA
jgi:hypothetical protein